jgi:hypothetical protein
MFRLGPGELFFEIRLRGDVLVRVLFAQYLQGEIVGLLG